MVKDVISQPPPQQQQQQQQPPQQQQQQHRHHNHQQSKFFKDVISHILDAVDDEVVRRGVAGGGGGGGDRQHQQGNQEGQQQQGGQTPMVSSSSTKSLRDVLIGSSSAPAAKTVATTGQGKAQGGNKTTTAAEQHSKGVSTTTAAEPPTASEALKSAKIKPGMSYKAMLEPENKPKVGVVAALPSAPPPKPSKPVNAWARKLAGALPSSGIVKGDTTAVAKAVGGEKKGVSVSQQPLQQGQQPATTNSDKRTLSEKKKPIEQNGSGLIPLTKPSVEKKEEKGYAANVVAATNDKNQEVVSASIISASVTDNNNHNPNSIAEEEEVTEADASSIPSPPLSTLLGPENLNSASSSVASSLEAPHSTRLRLQSSSGGGVGAVPNAANISGVPCSEDDVGYHLLNICSQLSEEIDTFMGRRALALDVRRRERSAVLSALGDTLGVRFLFVCPLLMP